MLCCFLIGPLEFLNTMQLLSLWINTFCVFTDSKCYCDEFCNRTAGHDDCCPDYPQVCLGIKPEPSPLPAIKLCRYRGEFYQIGETVTQDCHTWWVLFYPTEIEFFFITSFFGQATSNRPFKWVSHWTIKNRVFFFYLFFSFMILTSERTCCITSLCCYFYY